MRVKSRGRREYRGRRELSRHFPKALSILAESEGYKPADFAADFDRLIEISGESGTIEVIDENMLLDGMPDFTPFLLDE